MRSIFLGIAIVVIEGGLVVAAPQIKQADCGALESWGRRVNTETYAVAPRLQLPKALEDAQVVPLFGIGVFAWTQEDLQAANQLLTKCWTAAGQRRDAEATGALARANQALQGYVPRTNAALQKARSDAETVKKQIDALPNSADLDHALGVLLKADPATPNGNAYQGLPREVVDPIWRLAQTVVNLADSERHVLYAALGERQAAIETGIRTETAQAIAGAPADASGVINLMQARRQADALADPDGRAKLQQSADQRMKEVRETLRQAKPPVWVPPDCIDLYKWSGASDATAPFNLGDRGSIITAFRDERVAPVFGISLGEWTDDDLARFKSLRALCAADWQAQAAIPRGAGVDAPELVQLAAKGRWIDGANDRTIADSRNLIAASRKGQQVLVAAIEKVKALPETPESIAAINQLGADPTLAALGPADRNALTSAVQAKLAAISAHSADAAIKGLDGINVASPADLDKLWAYFAQSIRTIPDARAQQNFRDAFTRTLQQASVRMLPAFKANLEKSPATLANVAQANLKLLQLRTAPFGVSNTATFQTYLKTMEASRDAMSDSARGQACTEFAASLGATGDAKQPLWNGRDAITLGEFLCEIAEHGTVESYAGPGMFSSTSTVKATPLKSQMFTISMHKVEVQAGKPMLVGFEVKDSAQAKAQAVAAGAPGYSITPNGPVTVEGWELFLPNIIGFNGSEPDECMKVIDNATPDKLAPAAKLFYLNCWTDAHVRDRVAKSKGW